MYKLPECSSGEKTQKDGEKTQSRCINDNGLTEQVAETVEEQQARSHAAQIRP